MLEQPPAPEYPTSAASRKKSAPAGRSSKPAARRCRTPPVPPPPRARSRSATNTTASTRKSAEDAGDQHPVEQLEGAHDAPPHEKHAHAGEERPDADVVRHRGVGRAGDPPRHQEEDRARRVGGPGRPAGLHEVERRVHPGPERGRGRGAHEPGEDRLAGGERVAHQLGVEDRLQKHRGRGHPQERQPVADEHRRPEQELAAPDGEARARSPRGRRRRASRTPWAWAASGSSARTHGSSPDRASGATRRMAPLYDAGDCSSHARSSPAAGRAEPSRPRARGRGTIRTSNRSPSRSSASARSRRISRYPT